MPAFATPVARFMNGMMVRRYRRSSGGPMMGMNMLVLTTVGAKSGKQRETPLGCFPDGDNAWLIVASAAGSVNNPAWYHNLAAHPDQVKLETGGKSYRATAAPLSGAERDAAWQRIKTESPRYAGYEQKTDRLIPIIRLTAV
jgi:deazaflavin-dependent oxidoreductase (nitroreductase family)